MEGNFVCVIYDILSEYIAKDQTFYLTGLILKPFSPYHIHSFFFILCVTNFDS